MMDFIIHGENFVSLNGFSVVIRPLLLSFQTKVFHGDPVIVLGDGGKLWKCEDRHIFLLVGHNREQLFLVMVYGTSTMSWPVLLGL